MNVTDLDLLCEELTTRNIYSEYINKYASVNTIKKNIKKFAKSYWKTSSHNIMNILMNDSKNLTDTDDVKEKKFSSDYVYLFNKNGEFSSLNNESNIKIDVSKLSNKKNQNLDKFVDTYLYNNLESLIIPFVLLKNIINISIPDNCNLAVPLKLINYISKSNLISSNYINIDIGKNSNLFIYQYNQTNVHSINSNIININLHENSQLEYTNLQNESLSTLSFQNIFVNQISNSTFTFNNVGLGGNFLFNNVNVKQIDENNNFITRWIDICSGNQKIYDKANVEHRGNNGSSLENFKGIYYNNASRILDNMVYVNKNAQNIKSHQLSENLVISNSDYIKILPAMKIYSDNIQCTHGVVIDKINKNILFYMCARGMNRRIANDIIIVSFIKKLFDDIGHKSIKNDIWYFLKAKLQTILI